MKKITLIFCILLLAVMVSPVQAAPHEPTGVRLDIFESGEQEFPARTAFYIQHGWSSSYPPHSIGLLRFELEVDGKIIEPTYYDNIHTPDGVVGHSSVYNFPDGMSGVHTFTGHWYVPCQILLVSGLIEECSSPTAHVDLRTTEVVVTFTH